MNGFWGLVREDLKNKLWLIMANWYVFGMFCLLYATKITIPAGEVRSLYTGPGNTSFFAAMVLMGIVMGGACFRYLYSEKKSDLYLSLPFSRGQLFWAGYLGNFLIFSVPAILCKLLFFRLSLSMGYCRYEDSVRGVWTGCLFLVLGFLVVMNFSMLAFFLAQNYGYMIGLLLFFFLGPFWGCKLAESMLGIFNPSFYRSEILETISGYLSPLSLLANASGIREYADGAYWDLGSHLPYIGYMGLLACLLSACSFLVFIKRPAERKSGMFTFRWGEWLVRYGCTVLIMLWLIDVFQVFTVDGKSIMPSLVGAMLFIPLVHGFLNAALAFDAKKFVSAGKHLLVEVLTLGFIIGVFALAGKHEAQLPGEDQVASMALAITAQKSGDCPEDVLENMELTGKELSAAYQMVSFCEEAADPQAENYEILVKYNMKDKTVRYRSCRIPLYMLSELKDIFSGEEFKRGTYASLRLDELKYYEIHWSNGMESYTLDLEEGERTGLLEAYREDMEELSFSDICIEDPIGVFNFVSTKNQGDVTGYIYPGFQKTRALLRGYGISVAKSVSDYEITKIVMDQYLLTDGLLYDVRALESRRTARDREQIQEMAKKLVPEELCIDSVLLRKDTQREYTVYYKDSDGRTVNSIKCLGKVG